jgi:hypothetical protein
MQDWMLSIVIAGVGFISTFAVLKQKVTDSVIRDNEQDDRFKEYKNKIDEEIQGLQKFKNETLPAIEHYSRIEQGYGKKLDYHSQEITKLSQQISQAPTMKEVRDEFVTKEMYKQMQKHIDEKFDKLENGIEKILFKLD